MGNDIMARAAAAPADDSVVQSVADAMNNAASKASDDAAKVRSTVADAGPRALRAMSRATYVSAYVLAYGVVLFCGICRQDAAAREPIDAWVARWWACRPGCPEGRLNQRLLLSCWPRAPA